MAKQFLKLQENQLDKLYNNMLKEHSVCTNIISGENFAEDVISDSRRVYHDISKHQEDELLIDIHDRNKKLNAAKDNFYGLVN